MPLNQTNRTNQLIQTIQFVKGMQFSSIWPYMVLPLRASVDLGAMAMKEYPTFPKVQASLESHHGGGVFLFCRDAVGVFYNSANPYRLMHTST